MGLNMKSQKITFNQLNYSLKKAFYSFEGYMNEYNDDYSYSGFENLFATYFKVIKNPSNNTTENNYLTKKYYKVIYILINLIDNGIDDNVCIENKAFAADLGELKLIFENNHWPVNKIDIMQYQISYGLRQNFTVKDILGEIEDEIEPQELKFNSFKYSIKQNGFFDLPKVQELSPDKQTELIKYILNSKPIGVAMFEFLGYFKYLDNFFKTKENASKFVNRLYRQDAKDGDEVRKLRYSLVKPNSRYNAEMHTKEAEKYYHSLK